MTNCKTRQHNDSRIKKQFTIGQTRTDSITMPFAGAGEFTMLSELVRKAKR
jgi:hypothetical protein